jgi:hypothetical protein
MPQSYRQIGPDLARRIRLVVTDVDGTLTTADNSISLAALEAVRCLEESGIVVGLASGRALPRMESLAQRAGITGPIIAENGGVARLHRDGQLVDFGYSRQPAIQALEKLKGLFPQAIEETEDDKFRLIDLGIKSHGVGPAELRRHLDDVQLLDSGYMLHLLQKGVSKGITLMRLLGKIGDGNLSPEEVMVFGDSTTDVSMFQRFPHSVLIVNPRLPAQQRQAIEQVAEYVSILPLGEGFAQVVQHILDCRSQ